MRYAGLDITVYESADKRPPGHLSRQGPEALRWALYEVAQSATRRTSPDWASDQAVRHRLNHKRACLSVARKLCRRAYPILRALGEDALAPVDPRALPPLALVGRSAPGARSRGGRAAATAQHDAAG